MELPFHALISAEWEIAASGTEQTGGGCRDSGRQCAAVGALESIGNGRLERRGR